MAVACSSLNPFAPDAKETEAQVSSNGAWRGTFGERGAVSGSGGVGSPFLIGNGRQCATVTLVSGTSTIVRIGMDGRLTLNPPNNATGTVCGTGLIGSGNR